MFFSNFHGLIVHHKNTVR